MLVQIVQASIRPEERGRWLKVISQNAARTRTEEGCESYHVSEDLEAPNTFYIVELWADMEAVHRHFRAKFVELMAALDGVFTIPPEATFYTVTSTSKLGDILAAAGIAFPR